MNGDALAAVVAAAVRLFVREQSIVRPANGVRWNLAARVPTPDAARARLIAHARSRWAIRERLRE